MDPRIKLILQRRYIDLPRTIGFCTVVQQQELGGVQQTVAGSFTLGAGSTLYVRFHRT